MSEESRERVLEDFADVSGWLAVASGEATLAIARDGGAMRLDFDFHGGGGFVVARREIALTLPEAYAVHFDVRGAAPINRFELKLADPSGRNVWWWHEQAMMFGDGWRPVVVRSGQIEFAWGPAGGGAPSAIGAIELAVIATTGGRGTVWIRDLRLEDRTPRTAPRVTATSARPGHGPERVFDGSAATSWRSDGDGAQALEVDFGIEREYGGLVVHWTPDGRARAFTVRTSNDAVAWTTAYVATQADAARSYVYMPATSARHLRLDLAESVAGRGYGIAALEVRPYEFSRSLHAFVHAIAADAPRGLHPKWTRREATYWSPVAVVDPATCAIVNEEGMVEVDRGTFSLEPFVHAGGRLLTWADVETRVGLEDGFLPVPSVVWRAADLTLTTTAFARRIGGRAVLFVRYRVAGATRAVRLFVAIRPYQVTPPWQAFGALGGAARIGRIEGTPEGVCVGETKVVIPLDAPDAFGTLAFEQGPLTDHLARGAVPQNAAITDAFGMASAALAFDVDRGSRDVVIAVPFGDASGAVAGTSGEEAFVACANQWRTVVGGVEFDLPAVARDHGAMARTAIAHVLVNRDGPALQPGPRRYTRSWIRDGALMAAALLRMGRREEAEAFVRWYADYQLDDGFVPCCVDRNGADLLVEHDSHGQLVYAVAECFRFTKDRAFVDALWPRVAKAVAKLDALRATRLGPDVEPAKRGLLPESASHEGYLAHPVHSYWDDFWAIRALGDAAMLAEARGEAAEAERLRTFRDDVRASVRASIDTVIADRKIAYVPGSVEWADFDPTATSNAVGLLGELAYLPRVVLEATFDQYLAGFRRRVRGEIDWNNYTAYEVRIVGALVALGRRDDANELLDFLLADRRPLAWNQWPEISWRDPKSPGHLGDVPHAWIAAEYVLAFRSMLAFEDETAQALVVGAGIPWRWLADGEPVAVRGLPTHRGRLDFTLRRAGDAALACTVGGALAPGTRIVLAPPLPRRLRAVDVDGAASAAFDEARATIDRCPATVLLRY